MSEIISKAKIADVNTDISNIGKSANELGHVNPRYGNRYKTIPQLSMEFQQAVQDALLTGQNLQQAIDTALAAGAGQAGWTAGLVVDASGKNQQHINDITVKFATNITNLRTMATDKESIYQTLGYVLPTDKGSSRYYADLSDTTSVDDGFSVIVATDGTRWKLLFEDTINIAQAGVTSASPSLDGKFNKVSLFASQNGVSKVQLNSGEFTASETLLLYPYVTVTGVSMERTHIKSSVSDYVLKRVLRPDQPVGAYVVAANIKNMTVSSTLTDKTAKIITGKRYRNCSDFKVEFARGLYGMSLGDGTGGGPSGGEQYFNETKHCRFASCVNGVQFNGASNRNTFENNSYMNCDAAYDFSTIGNVSETNVFTNENVEGCKRWAKWGPYIENIYKQVWIGLTVENPTTNGFVCEFEDPSAQVFINLALIPNNNLGAVNWTRKFGTRRSIILGMATGGAQHENPPSEIYGGLDVYGDQTRAMSGLQVRGKIQHYSTTSVASIALGGTVVPAGSSVTKTVAMADLVRGNILSYGLNFDPTGLTFTPYCNNDGVASVKIRNVTAADITIASGSIILNCINAIVT